MGTCERFDAVGFLAGLFQPAGKDGPAGSVRADGLPERIGSPDDLPPKWRNEYERRAVIREYAGGQAREHAEAEALTETVMAMRAAGRDRGAGRDDDGGDADPDSPDRLLW